MAELWLFWYLVGKFNECNMLYGPNKRIVVSCNLYLYLHRQQIHYGHTPPTLCYACMYNYMNIGLLCFYKGFVCAGRL
jgi:hypothetical protein